VRVEDGDGGSIDELVVSAVVYEDDTAIGEDGWRAWFDDAGVKHSGAAREDGSGGGFSPVEQIVGVGEAHLVSFVGGGAEPVHPIMAVDFFGDDGAGLGPTDVPVAFVGWEDYAFAIPMD